MINMNDIYIEMEEKLLESDFYECDIELKRKLIDVELKKYIISKIIELNPNSIQEQSSKQLDVYQLLEILASMIPVENHMETIEEFVHYILLVAGNIQNRIICWMIEEDTNLIENPLAEFDENGYWATLTTHEKTSSVKTFNFVYDLFQNSFMKESFRKELLIEKD